MLNPLAMMGQLQNIQKLMQGNNPNAVYNYMIKNNPQFAQFVEANKGKSPEQIAQENGIDLNQIRRFF